MRRRALIGLAVLLPFAGAASAVPARDRPALGLDLGSESPGGPALRDRTVQEVRRSGVNLFVLSLSWSAAEPTPRGYRVAELTRAARMLRQSGALLHLDLGLVVGRERDVPADLAAVAFDDRRLSLRLGGLFDALEPALLDFETISLGHEADSYFADKPEQLRAFRRLFDGLIAFLGTKAPHLKAGLTTRAPTESAAPLVAALLHQKSPVLFYVYAPFRAREPYRHRAPSDLERDWRALLDAAKGRPIAFPEVSFSSAPENDSSPRTQAEFIRRLRRFLRSADGRRLLFARYVRWKDEAPRPLLPAASERDRRRAEFFAHRGLRTEDGAAKPAWQAWLGASR